MSLRARIAIGFTVILVTLISAMVAVVGRQHENLVEQLDAQLAAASVLALGPPLPQGVPFERLLPPDLEAPVSELYVGTIDVDGSQTDLLSGQLLDGNPSVTIAQADGTDGMRFFDADGVGTTTQFRVLAVDRDDGTWGLVALPLTDAAEATRELAVALAIVVAIIAIVLALISWWIVRLGLRPIAELTQAADRIAAGQTGLRVDIDAPRTEAGRLGVAFNLMLDERDENEDLLRRFVADASHELRTPLTSMRGYLDLYVEGGFRSPGDLDDALRRMRNEAMRMNDLVEDLLLLASLDQGRPLTISEVDLADVLRDAASDANAMNPDRPIDLDLDASARGDLVVEGDDARLRQLIGSLVHNAVIHTPSQTSIRLAADRRQDDVVVTISDDGPGLDEHDAAHVFDRFYRGDPSRRRPAGGSGLGLSIVRSLVDAHGGTITLRTEPGKGCAFTITMARSVRPMAVEPPVR